MKPTKVKMTEERYNSLKQIFDQISCNTEVLKSLNISRSTYARIKRSTDWLDYKEKTIVRRKPVTVVQQEVKSEEDLSVNTAITEIKISVELLAEAINKLIEKLPEKRGLFR